MSLWREWQRDDDYSVGQLVPLVALYLAWHDRKQLAALLARPAWLAGCALLLLAQAIRGYGLVFLYESLERYSLVVTVVGVVLLVWGWRTTWALRWILLFLFLMVPLPGRVHNLISAPLQDMSTAGAVLALELFGNVISREGHVMVLNDETRVAVAEACSGLRMLTAFVVVAATFAYIARRASWQKAVLLASSVPIAIGCNMMRLVVTAWLFMFTSSDTAEKFFHDFAGLSMMPLAVVMLIGEMWLMSKLVAPAPAVQPRPGSAAVRERRPHRHTAPVASKG